MDSEKQTKRKRERLFVHIGANLAIVLVVAAVLTASLFGTGAVLTNAKGKAIYRGNTNEPRVSLMVNVYWGTEYLDEMLETFARYQVKTTFFIGGTWAAKNGELLKKIGDAGHELGNHGYLHSDHKTLTQKQNEDEIGMAEKQIYSYSGQKTTLFAPPSGSMGDAMFAACEKLSYRVIMWSRDTIDWRDKDEDLVLKRATKNIQNGELVLMHPTAHTAKALPKILEFYRQNGLVACPVSDNLQTSAA